MFKVQILQLSDGVVVKEFTATASERQAEQLERGVNINLNHDKYCTRIVKE